MGQAPGCRIISIAAVNHLERKLRLTDGEGAFCCCGGTELFDVTICHPLSQVRIRDESANLSNLLNAAWTAKVSRYSGMLQAVGTRFNLLPVPLSTLGGWHLGAHRALCSVATTIAARGLSTFSRARSILFQRHAALLVTNNALYLMSGLLSDI